MHKDFASQVFFYFFCHSSLTYYSHQGESNAGAPERYAKCFPAMIQQWRKDWSGPSLDSSPTITSTATAATSTATAATSTAAATTTAMATNTTANLQPFIFAQIAPWPDHDVGIIAGIRYAQLAALEVS